MHAKPGPVAGGMATLRKHIEEVLLLGAEPQMLRPDASARSGVAGRVAIIAVVQYEHVIRDRAVAYLPGDAVCTQHPLGNSHAAIATYATGRPEPTPIACLLLYSRPESHLKLGRADDRPLVFRKHLREYDHVQDLAVTANNTDILRSTSAAAIFVRLGETRLLSSQSAATWWKQR